MSPPYLKRKHTNPAWPSKEPGWVIEDGDGGIIAILDTETMTDLLVRMLYGVNIIISLEGGTFASIFSNVPATIVTVDEDVSQAPPDLILYAKHPATGKVVKGCCQRPPITCIADDDAVSDIGAVEILADVCLRGKDSAYYSGPPAPPVDKHVRWATLGWTVNDVLTKAKQMNLDLSEQEAEEFLHNSASQIRDDMVARGWDSIETLLSMREQPQ